jgi:hypothetical protein
VLLDATAGDAVKASDDTTAIRSNRRISEIPQFWF